MPIDIDKLPKPYQEPVRKSIERLELLGITEERWMVLETNPDPPNLGAVYPIEELERILNRSAKSPLHTFDQHVEIIDCLDLEHINDMLDDKNWDDVEEQYVDKLLQKFQTAEAVTKILKGTRIKKEKVQEMLAKYFAFSV